MSILISAMPPKKKSAVTEKAEVDDVDKATEKAEDDVDMAEVPVEAPDGARELELEKMFDLDDDWSLPGAGAVTKKRQQGRAKTLSVAQAVGFVL